MTEWIFVTDDPATWPPISVIVLAMSTSPYHFVQLLCVEELDSDRPKSFMSWKVPHNIYEDAADIISYECSSTYAGIVTHWRPIRWHRDTLEADRMTTHLDSLASAFGAEITDHLERMKSVKSQDDPIKHPSHYTSHPSGIEPIEICAYETFYRGNFIKYIMRAPYKGCELQDLKKARQYLDLEINRVEELEI